MSNADIHTLNELRNRKLELEMEEKAAREGLTNALAKTPKAAREYAIEDLALPALGVGLAVYATYRVLRSGKKDQQSAVQRVDEQAPLRTSHTAYPERPHPRATAAVPPPPQPAATQSATPPPTKKSAFDWGKMLAAGKLIVPAVQAITTIVMNQRTHEEVQETQEQIAS